MRGSLTQTSSTSVERKAQGMERDAQRGKRFSHVACGPRSGQRSRKPSTSMSKSRASGQVHGRRKCDINVLALTWPGGLRTWLYARKMRTVPESHTGQPPAWMVEPSRRFERGPVVRVKWGGERDTSREIEHSSGVLVYRTKRLGRVGGRAGIQVRGSGEGDFPQAAWLVRG